MRGGLNVGRAGGGCGRGSPLPVALICELFEIREVFISELLYMYLLKSKHL